MLGNNPQEQRNERLAQKIIKNLKRRHIEGFYCATAEEAVKKVSEPLERKKGLDVSPFFVIRLGLEPKTPTLKVLCSTN